MSIPGVKLTQVTDAIHRIERSSGVEVRIQNSSTRPSVSTPLRKDLYGVDYAEQVLGQQFYKEKHRYDGTGPHGNRPVMDAGAKDLRAVLTLSNDTQNQVLSSNAHKEFVLDLLQAFPPGSGSAAKTSLSVGAGAVLHTAASKGRHLSLVATKIDVPRDPYRLWLTRPNGIEFTTALNQYTDHWQALVKNFDPAKLNSNPHYFSNLISNLRPLRHEVVARAETGARYAEDLSATALSAVKEAETRFIKALEQKFFAAGYLLENKDRLSLKPLRLSAENQTDHAKKTALKASADLSQLPAKKQAELKVWEKDVSAFYRARQGHDTFTTKRVEADLLLEEFKTGLTSATRKKKFNLFNKKIKDLTQLETPLTQKLTRLETEITQAAGEVRQIKFALQDLKQHTASSGQTQEARLRARLSEKKNRIDQLQQQWNETAREVRDELAMVTEIQAKTIEAAHQLVSRLPSP